MRQSIVIMARHQIAVSSTLKKPAEVGHFDFQFGVVIEKALGFVFLGKCNGFSLLPRRKNWGSRTVSWELSDFFFIYFCIWKNVYLTPSKNTNGTFSAQTCNAFVTFENLDSYSNHVSYRNRKFELLYISVFYRWHIPSPEYEHIE